MANLLTIDDHPGLLPDQVSHVFHAPARRVEIARTGAEGLQRVADVRLCRIPVNFTHSQRA